MLKSNIAARDAKARWFIKYAFLLPDREPVAVFVRIDAVHDRGLRCDASASERGGDAIDLVAAGKHPELKRRECLLA
jgi:hypothetical protein